jgi:hypothetical protein
MSGIEAAELLAQPVEADPPAEGQIVIATKHPPASGPSRVVDRHGQGWHRTGGGFYAARGLARGLAIT